MIASLVYGALLLSGPSSVTLRFQPKVGGTYVYSSSSSMSMMMGPSAKPMPNSFSMTMTYKVLAKKQDKYTIQITTTGLKSDGMMASMMGAGSNINLKMDVDQYGKAAAAAAAGPMAQTMASGVQGIGFSKAPLHVGSTWTDNIDMSKLGGAMSGTGMKASGTITSHYTVQSIKSVGGKTVVVIANTISGTMKVSGQMAMENRMSGGGTMEVDASTGMLIKNDSLLKSDVSVAGQKVKSETKQTLKLISAK